MKKLKYLIYETIFEIKWFIKKTIKSTIKSIIQRIEAVLDWVDNLKYKHEQWCKKTGHEVNGCTYEIIKHSKNGKPSQKRCTYCGLVKDKINGKWEYNRRY